MFIGERLSLRAGGTINSSRKCRPVYTGNVLWLLCIMTFLSNVQCRAVSPQQLSFLFIVRFIFITYRPKNNVAWRLSCKGKLRCRRCCPRLCCCCYCCCAYAVAVVIFVVVVVVVVASVVVVIAIIIVVVVIIIIIVIVIIITRSLTPLTRSFPPYLQIIPEPTDEETETTETASPSSESCVVIEESPAVPASSLLGLHSARLLE